MDTLSQLPNFAYRLLSYKAQNCHYTIAIITTQLNKDG